MTGLTEALRERIRFILAEAADGVRPEDGCPVCAKHPAWCDECTGAAADKQALDDACKRIGDAKSAEEATAIGTVAFAVVLGADKRTADAIRAAIMPARVTEAGREFAIAALDDGGRYLLGADAEDAELKTARHRAADQIRMARTYEEIGIAVTGGTK